MDKKPIIEHLEELRLRMIKIILIIFFGILITFNYGDFFIELLLRPIRIFFLNSGSGQIIYTGLLDKILSQMQLSLWLSVVLTSPLWFFQIWRFIKPALLTKEIKIVRPLIIISFLLFCLGVFLGHAIVLPLLIKLFINFGVSNVNAFINMKDYLILSSKLILGFGILFQIPNIIIILRMTNIVSFSRLNSARRYAYVAFTILAAIVTPPDVFTMLLVLVPLIILFEIGLVLSFIMIRK